MAVMFTSSSLFPHNFCMCVAVLLMAGMILNVVEAVSLRDAYYAHQRVKSDLHQPQILSPNQNYSPVIEVDPLTGNVRILQPRLTLRQIFDKAVRNMQETQIAGADVPAMSEDAFASRFNRFRHVAT